LLVDERARILRLLIDHIAFDGVAGEMAIEFRPVGIKLLAAEAATAAQGAAA
jgi:hypothetical protein